MELVYLWVEKYKNIENQGFNFSPRFDCEYDKDSNELTIDENKDYVSIFPKNINITAIVGENGSGKSNLLDLIIELDGWAKTTNSFFFVNSNKIIYTINFDKHIKSILDIEKINRNEPERVSTKNLTDISYLTISPFINDIQSLYSKGINILSIFDKRNHENDIFKFNHFFLDLIPKIPKILEDKGIQKFFKIKEKPNYLIFKINKTVKDVFKKEVTKLFSKSLKKDESVNSYLYQADIVNDSLIQEIFNLFKKMEEKKETNYSEVNKINNTKVANKIPNINGKKTFDKVNTANDMNQDRLKREKESLLKEIDNIGKMDFYFAKEKNSNNSFNFSSGELVVLFYIEKLQELNLKEDNLILLIDECELFLHPEWQKKLISYIVSLFNRSKFNRQLIITSHSPFIISDIPKKNLIFLKNGEHRYPFENSQTFGANIHTLLSDGFFMEGGLMGEFAKNKIKEVIKLLKSKRKLSARNKGFCKHIISIIGEPILQRTLEHQLNEKLNPNETELQRLEREQKELQAKINKIKQSDNDEAN